MSSGDRGGGGFGGGAPGGPERIDGGAGKSDCGRRTQEEWLPCDGRVRKATCGMKAIAGQFEGGRRTKRWFLVGLDGGQLVGGSRRHQRLRHGGDGNHTWTNFILEKRELKSGTRRMRWDEMIGLDLLRKI